MKPSFSRLLSIAATAIAGLALTSAAAQALFDPSRVGRKVPSAPEAAAEGLFANQRAQLGSQVSVLMANVLSIRQTPAFNAPVVPICANADKQPGWSKAALPFRIKAYQDARLRIEQRNHPTREFDTLWAHLADTDGRGCEGWLRIDTRYELEPRTGDYAASPLKVWNDRLADESRAEMESTIKLQSNVMLALTPGGVGPVCAAGTEVRKTGETRGEGARVAFKVLVTKGGTKTSCLTGSIGWLRGDVL